MISTDALIVVAWTKVAMYLSHRDYVDHFTRIDSVGNLMKMQLKEKKKERKKEDNN